MADQDPDQDAMVSPEMTSPEEALPAAEAVEAAADVPVAAEPEAAKPEAEVSVVEEPAAAEPAAVEAAAPPAFDPNLPGMDWYIIHTYSGFENKVSESLKARAAAYNFEDKLGQVLIPTEEVVELRNGKKYTSKRLLFPGYVMVQMAMDDDLWHHVKNTPRVTGFVGGGGAKPVPLTANEVNAMFNRQTTAAERPRPKLTFEKNEQVRIVDGPFAGFQGKVDEVNPERATLRILVTIFGRPTPVELEFLQVEKVS